MFYSRIIIYIQCLIQKSYFLFWGAKKSDHGVEPCSIKFNVDLDFGINHDLIL